MKEKLIGLLRTLFSLTSIIAVIGGVVTFLLFLIAVIIGGAAATNLSLTARNVLMPWFIRSASVAVAAGLLISYISKKHALSIDVEKAGDVTE